LIPFDPWANIPILYTAASSCAYRVFVTTFEAMEVPFFQQERVLQFPGHGCTDDKLELVPKEFVAEENVNYQKEVSASEGANAEDRTVTMTNLPSPPLQEEPSRVTRQGPLTFDPSSLTKEAKEDQLLAADKQAKLMQWHCRLGHLTFPKLK
jgi:hypothetical protein